MSLLHNSHKNLQLHRVNSLHSIPHSNPSMSTDTETAINYNFQIPATPSRYLRAFLAYAKVLEDWRLDEIMACSDATLVHRILPASLGWPVRAKEAYVEFWKDVPALFGGNKFVFTIHEVIESGHKLAIHCSSKSVSARGTPYTNEYSLFIHYVPLPAGVDPYSPLAEGEELPKMALVKEFVDSGYTSAFFAGEGEGATAVVLNKGILFSVLKHGFLVKYTPFETMFSMPPEDPKNVEGSSADNPIVLEDTSAKDFRAFLRVLYPLGVEPVTDYDDWLGVLRLAHKWEFVEIREKAVSAIGTKIGFESPDVKIDLGNRFLVQDWLKQGLVNIALRKDLELKELREKPYSFDHETICRFFYIQSKAWQKTANKELDGYAQTSFHSYVTKQVSILFQTEISRARYVSEVERRTPRKPASPMQVYYDNDSDSD
ncbi:hypothetical protein D9619_002120 [Psilocybe cf. subviscida]|uniref:BTB domain-containing protein n=1 Tax=Psilocybe cf. subviscida TaxID=2480587 RepID=A0A8H5BEV6_9AGAR|nr:hypothetical protein D9619_002120 [Psilocybe cf. subviscida]